ncbi:tetratricopeptide repeat protein [Chryseosolibacter indicus]|uniref:Tetratricopeptide repeat protein n=1 Tax=Chryseosolibacter indicus TaxID=2782351 RepID=A0ABS5VWV6_9BACT|nr:tetratricopeptide repeat protein [Chryseosolibacter indicus]MBT1705320.1 tetratricopeptide repeat protein [Chryseosolibacter indicus]
MSRGEADYDIALNNIGLTYYKLRDYKKALSYYRQCIDAKIKLQDYFDLDRALINIGLCYRNLNDFSKAKYYVDSAFNVCKTNCSDIIKIEGNFCLGKIYTNLLEFEIAKDYFIKSYVLAKRIGDTRFSLENISELASILIRKDRIEEAVKYLREAETFITNDASYNLEITRIYSCYIDLYRKIGDYKRLALYQEKYILLKNSILSETLTTGLMKIEAEHLQKENMARIETQKQVIELTQKNIAVQRWVNILIGVIAFALLIVIMLLIRINKTRKTINEALEKKVQERTKELQQSRDSWHKAYEVKEQLIAKATTEIKSSIATLKGLSTLGLKQFKEPDAIQYMQEVELTSGNLMSVIEVFNNKEFT